MSIFDSKHDTITWSVIAIYIAALFSVSCIKNDIPYPRIQANIVNIEVEGQSKGAVIDSISRTATLFLSENVDINSVKINNYALTPGAKVVNNSFESSINLSTPLKVTLHLYQDYEWTLLGQQEIERYFVIEGQVGSTIIDVEAKRIVADVPATADLKSLHIERAKLGSESSVMTPDMTNGAIIDATEPIEILVEAFGKAQIWHLYIRQVESTVSTVSVDAWTCVVRAYGQAEAGKDNGIEYRRQGEDTWNKVPESQLSIIGGSFCGKITNLEPLSNYEARAYSEDEYGEIISFTTGAMPQIPDASLDNWWLDGKVWCPWAEGGEQYWDTGNKGATTLGSSNSVPTEDTATGTGYAAMLETRFVGIGSVGKLAAGNLFFGRYVRTDGTNGVLSFGREFTERPTKIKGYMKYNCANISHTTAEFSHLQGEPDTCIVWCALIDSDQPFEIRTNPNNRNLFNPEASYVVAYGKFEVGETVSSYIPFEFDLNYTATNRRPRYILITASASKYGDYFTGGAGSILYLDNLELDYK